MSARILAGSSYAKIGAAKITAARNVFSAERIDARVQGRDGAPIAK
jgi:hypothetical protein